MHAIEHAPAVHEGAPLTDEQAAPHAPQCATVLNVFVSHPFKAIPSQLPHPPSHATTAHVPPAHVSVALGRLHAVLHAPQLTSVLSGDSQPLPMFPSQSPIPAAHEAHPHVPAAHVGVPPVHVQPCPHVPQWLVFVCVFVSHPLIGLPSQSAIPELHTGVHTPATHVVVPLGFVHSVPHAPQWLTVLDRSVSHPLLRLVSQLP